MKGPKRKTAQKILKKIKSQKRMAVNLRTRKMKKKRGRSLYQRILLGIQRTSKRIYFTRLSTYGRRPRKSYNKSNR